jgi:uncharacterized membrane protein YfcA
VLGLGALAVLVASFVGGATGFGYALVCTPLLLLVGYPLDFVVTSNLALSLVTRVSAVYRFREHVVVRRVAYLIAGLVPGLVVGLWVLDSVSTRALEISAGVTVVVIALLLARSVDAPPPAPLPGGAGVAGLVGGVMGATTSLSGVAPALLLAREETKPASFIGDMAAYFVVSCAILLAGLAIGDRISTDALYPAFLVWLPVSLVGNLLGTIAGTRLPPRQFRRAVLALLVVCGAVAAATA